MKRPKEYLKKIAENPVIAMVTTLSVPALALLWDDAVSNVELKVLFGFSVFVIAVIFVVILIVQTILNTSLKEEFYSKISILEKFIESSGSGWISTAAELALEEKTVDDILVITYDMKNDIEDKDVREAVKENLAAGKSYTYILPFSNSSLGLIEDYKRFHNFKDNQVGVVFMPQDRFTFLNEIVIYNLHSKKPIVAYCVYPSDEYVLHIKLDKTHTMKAVGLAKEIMKQYGKQQLIDDVPQEHLKIQDNYK